MSYPSYNAGAYPQGQRTQSYAQPQPQRTPSYAGQQPYRPPAQAASYAQPQRTASYAPQQPQRTPSYAPQQTPSYAPTYGAPQPTPSYPTQHPGHTPTANAPPQASWTQDYYKQLSPQQLQNLQAWFSSVDRDRSGTIEVHELQQVTFNGVRLGPEAATKLVKVFDKDRNGSIDFYEYAALHQFINRMRQAFQMADADKSQRIEAREIHAALQHSGFGFVTLDTTLELLHKYDKSRMGLSWNEFLMFAASIAHCRSMFEYNDKQRSGWITINLNQLIQLTSYLS